MSSSIGQLLLCTRGWQRPLQVIPAVGSTQRVCCFSRECQAPWALCPSQQLAAHLEDLLVQHGMPGSIATLSPTARSVTPSPSSTMVLQERMQHVSSQKFP